ncbi:hypothetical protein PUR71_32290 [Streptomyces sp. SP17BM10]|nr:hypothetical protein [Streptomyces sp. SP17BM10]MEE1787550.1 hypothetical protein [Streptomyces sp. SP17BM10]
MHDVLAHRLSLLVLHAGVLRDLTALVGEVVEAGHEVELALLGDPESIPTTHRLAVHRPVQEALTNARKRGDTAPVTVRFGYRGPGHHCRGPQRSGCSSAQRLGEAEQAAEVGAVAVVTTAADGRGPDCRVSAEPGAEGLDSAGWVSAGPVPGRPDPDKGTGRSVPRPDPAARGRP